MLGGGLEEAIVLGGRLGRSFVGREGRSVFSREGRSFFWECDQWGKCDRVGGSCKSDRVGGRLEGRSLFVLGSAIALYKRKRF